jgi:hypothetical protein
VQVDHLSRVSRTSDIAGWRTGGRSAARVRKSTL